MIALNLEVPLEECWEPVSPNKAGTNLILEGLGKLGVNSVEKLYMYVMYDAVWTHNGVALKLPRGISDLFLNGGAFSHEYWWRIANN